MKELLIDLQTNSTKALYEQIYEYIRKDITDGKISRGEKLPSTRFMAKNLQISRSTVELAYDQLVAEGYLESKPGAGYYACDASGLYRIQSRKDTSDLIEKCEKKNECKIRFSPFDIDEEHFPYASWNKVNKSINLEDDARLFLLGDSRGEIKLRKAISDYLHQARGVKCKENQIVIGAGNEYLLLLLSQILGSKKVVAMEKYTYLQAYRTFSNMEYVVCATDMDESGILTDEIRSLGPDIIYVMPSHQFPLGTVMPMTRRLELLKWTSEGTDRYIIEDDHDSEFRYKGRPIPSLQGSDNGEHVIYIGTFSKSIAPSIRVSYMVLPEKLLKKYYEYCGFYSTTVPRMQQEVLSKFMEEGHFARHLNRMRNIYKTKQEFLLKELKLQSWVHRLYGEHAGLHVLVEVDTKLTEHELVAKAEKKSLKIYGLSEYCIQRDLEVMVKYPTILLGYGNLNNKKVLEGIAILNSIMEEAK